MSLREDVRECPATYGLVASWIAVYAAMVWHQGVFFASGASILNLGAIQPETTHLFGALTWRDVARGEVWRLITATFLHASLPHLAMNLIGMLQLGRLMEPWYGARQFLAVCLGLGGTANVLGLLMRQGVAVGREWLQARGLAGVLPAALAGGPAPAFAANIASIGGSTVILGLIGLCLVVGWRSRTRVGAFLRDQMLVFLALTAVIGIVGARYVDNYGHAGGAVAGSVLGFFHRRIVRSAERGRARRLAGLASAALLAACLAGQALSARDEVRLAAREVGANLALKHAIDCEELRQRLIHLRDLAGPLALEQFSRDLGESEALGDPALLFGRHDAPAMELYDLAATRQAAKNPSIQELTRVLGDWLESIARLRPRLDARLAESPEIGDVLRLGDELLSGAIDSHRLQNLRLSRDLLELRSAALRDEWLAQGKAQAGAEDKP